MSEGRGLRGEFTHKWKNIAEITTPAIPIWDKIAGEIVLKRSCDTGTPLRELIDAIVEKVYPNMLRAIKADSSAPAIFNSIAHLVPEHTGTRGQANIAASQAASMSIVNSTYQPMMESIVKPALVNGIQKCALLMSYKQAHGFTDEWLRRTTMTLASVEFGYLGILQYRMGYTPQDLIDPMLWEISGPSTSLFNSDGTISEPTMYTRHKAVAGTCPFVSAHQPNNPSYTDTLYPLIDSALTQLREDVQKLPLAIRSSFNPLEDMLLTKGLPLGQDSTQLQVHLTEYMRENNFPHLARWKNIAYLEDPDVTYV